MLFVPKKNHSESDFCSRLIDGQHGMIFGSSIPTFPSPDLAALVIP
jgi:hypothetical protein